MRKFAKFVMLVVGSTIVALVVCLFAAGVSSSGVNLLELTHAFFWACFIVGVAGALIGTALLRFSVWYVLLAGVTTAVLLGGMLYWTNAYLTKKRVELDASNHPPQPINTPAPGLPKRVPINKSHDAKTPSQPTVTIRQHGAGSGAVGGNITTGPCSSVQVGGQSNQSSVNCVPASRILDDEHVDKFKAALEGRRGTLFIFPDGTDADVVPLAKQLCDLFRGHGATNCIGVPGSATQTSITLPTKVNGVHCYLTDENIRRAFRDSGLDCIYENQRLGEGGNTVAPAIVVGNVGK